MPKIDGLYRDETTGTASLVFDGVEYHLRRPKIRELRMLREAITSVTERVEQDVDELVEGTRKMTPEERDDREDRVIGWWILVIDTLGTDGRNVEAEDVPPWIFDPRNIPELLRHWMTRPTAPGG